MSFCFIEYVQLWSNEEFRSTSHEKMGLKVMQKRLISKKKHRTDNYL